MGSTKIVTRFLAFTMMNPCASKEAIICIDSKILEVLAPKADIKDQFGHAEPDLNSSTPKLQKAVEVPFQTCENILLTHGDLVNRRRPRMN